MSGKLSFGYLYDLRNPPQWERPWAKVYAETLDFITWSETVGIEGAWVPEHHGARDGYMPSPLVALAAIAARTKSLKIGTGVALAPLYHPVRFAEDCAVLDILADGRLEIALAIGYRRRETQAFGVDFTKRGRRFDEFLEIVCRLWAGETVTFEGSHFTVNDATIVPRPPRGRVPLFIGGFADKALDRVVKYGDGYFGNEEACGPYLEKLRIAGRDPAQARIRIPLLFHVVANDPEQAMHELAPYYHHVNNVYGEWYNEDLALGVDNGPRPMSLEQFKASGMLQILTPGQAIDHFRDLQARTSVEHLMLCLPPGLPPERFVPYAETLAREVIPAFR